MKIELIADNVIKIGVLGGAFIAQRSVLPAIKTLPKQYRLSGIACRDVDKCKKISAIFNCKSYDSYESLLLDASIDAVYIPLPNALHHKFVIMALEQGKHVLAEKSLGCTLQQVIEMNTIAESKNLVLVENFQFRFHSQLSTILDLLSEDIIGSLRSIRISFGFPPFSDPSNIRYSADLGGGALLDAGVYPLKIAPFFLGDDIYVAQATMAYDPQKGVDIFGGGGIQQQNGPLFCHFAYGFDHYYQCSLELWGSSGKLITNRIFTAPPGYNPTLFIETFNKKEERLLAQDDHFKNMLEYFYQLIFKKFASVKDEYKQNIKQAILIEEFKSHAKRI